MSHQPPAMTISALSRAYESGEATPTQIVKSILSAIAAEPDSHVWILQIPEAELLARAAALEKIGRNATHRLWGIPFAVKDNIDIQGLPTSAACHAFAATSDSSAPIVETLLAAGAILIGKTNLDQFATGLSGTRSPFGTPRNPLAPDHIPGGSSSGSAGAVARGWVSFALGSDTAGSGRVPAAFHNIIGLKATPGLVSTRGIVPASRSLDCAAIMALTVADAVLVRDLIAGFDSADPWSRHAPAHHATKPDLSKGFRFGVPSSAQFKDFGNPDAAALFAEAVARLETLGGKRIEIDFQPFAAASDMFINSALYSERAACIGDFVASHPDAVLPILRQSVARSQDYSAVELCRAHYRLMSLRRQSEAAWQKTDLILIPTAPRCYSLAEEASDPFAIPASLGHYCAFANLLGSTVVQVPSGFDRQGLPFGVSLVAPSYRDGLVSTLAEEFSLMADLVLGSTGRRLSQALGKDSATAANPTDDLITLALVAIDAKTMRGLGGELQGRAMTGPHYRLYLLPQAMEPALVAVNRGETGFAIELELWSLPRSRLGDYCQTLPAGAAIAQVQLEEGEATLGQVAQSFVVEGAVDISGYGSWQAYRQYLGKA
ncbi:MAG: allophanate hydrolase [Candidatus Pacebacteria bacterium]|nr:allophanate hydrolase [Candidatus Paceibacterota bacterium]